MRTLPAQRARHAPWFEAAGALVLTLLHRASALDLALLPRTRALRMRAAAPRWSSRAFAGPSFWRFHGAPCWQAETRQNPYPGHTQLTQDV